MMRLWPTLLEQLTPQASADGREQLNPFDAAAQTQTASAMSVLLPSDGQRTLRASSIQHHLLGLSSVSRPAQADVASLGPGWL